MRARNTTKVKNIIKTRNITRTRNTIRIRNIIKTRKTRTKTSLLFKVSPNLAVKLTKKTANF
jgi:hypothetical protein